MAVKKQTKTNSKYVTRAEFEALRKELLALNPGQPETPVSRVVYKGGYVVVHDLSASVVHKAEESLKSMGRQKLSYIIEKNRSYLPKEVVSKGYEELGWGDADELVNLLDVGTHANSSASENVIYEFVATTGIPLDKLILVTDTDADLGRLEKVATIIVAWR